MTPSLASESASTQQAPVDHRRDAYRWFFPLLGVLTLIAACIRLSLKKQEWADEVFTRIELSDPSLLHLMHALTRLGGAGMPLFSLTAWPWAHVVGFSDLSLRLYSCAGVCAAFLVLITTLRRYFTTRASFLGVAFGMFSSLIVIDQNGEARGYGLYLLLCALAIAQIVRVAETPRPRPRDLFLLALTQAGVVLGHVLGLIFAGLMLLALVFADLWDRRFRWKLYLCAIAGWLALLTWLPAIRAAIAVGKPHGWIPVPSFGDLIIGASYWVFAGIYFPLFQGTRYGVVAGWFCAVFCIAGVVLAAFYALRAVSSAKRLIYLLGLALLLAPFVFFVVSHASSSSIWVARYLVPTSLGIGILAAGWADRNRFTAGIGGVILSIALLLLPLATVALEKESPLNVTRIDQVAAGRPLVCDWVRDFMIMRRYSAAPATLEFPLDWPASLQGPVAAVGAYHLMDNYRRDGYMPGNLYDAQQVLSQPSFLVLDSTDTNWFQLDIANNPDFAWKEIARIDSQHRVIEVNHP